MWHKLYRFEHIGNSMQNQPNQSKPNFADPIEFKTTRQSLKILKFFFNSILGRG